MSCTGVRHCMAFIDKRSFIPSVIGFLTNQLGSCSFSSFWWQMFFIFDWQLSVTDTGDIKTFYDNHFPLCWRTNPCKHVRHLSKSWIDAVMIHMSWSICCVLTSRSRTSPLCLHSHNNRGSPSNSSSTPEKIWSPMDQMEILFSCKRYWELGDSAKGHVWCWWHNIQVRPMWWVHLSATPLTSEPLTSLSHEPVAKTSGV